MLPRRTPDAEAASRAALHSTHNRRARRTSRTLTSVALDAAAMVGTTSCYGAQDLQTSLAATKRRRGPSHPPLDARPRPGRQPPLGGGSVSERRVGQFHGGGTTSSSSRTTIETSARVPLVVCGVVQRRIDSGDTPSVFAILLTPSPCPAGAPSRSGHLRARFVGDARTACPGRAPSRDAAAPEHLSPSRFLPSKKSRRSHAMAPVEQTGFGEPLQEQRARLLVRGRDRRRVRRVLARRAARLDPIEAPRHE